MSPPARRTRFDEFLVTGSALLRVLVVGLFLLTFIVQPYRIPSASMVPTLQIGDCVLVTKTKAAQSPPDGSRTSPILAAQRRTQRLFLPPSGVRRGNLVVFHYPPDPSRELVKRIVAVPGDRLRLRGGRLLLNDQPLPEPYALYTPSRPEIFRDEFPNLREADPNIDPRWWLTLRRTLRDDGNLLVPPGSYFVLGDNRNNSEDSRYWGFVPRAEIIGQPLIVYFAVPNLADAPEGGALPRLHWLLAAVRGRIGILR